jgi:hypothetical protein
LKVVDQEQRPRGSGCRHQSGCRLQRERPSALRVGDCAADLTNFVQLGENIGERMGRATRDGVGGLDVEGERFTQQ